MKHRPKKVALKSWLWACVAKTFTVYALRPTRAATVLAELLGETFAGVTNCDRAKMYWSLGRLQWCWAHLKRDFQALVDTESLKPSGWDATCCGRLATCFVIGPATVTARLPDVAIQRLVKPICARRSRSCCCAVPSAAIRDLVGMCRELHGHRDWLWTFVEIEGIEPTNNASERALRHAVIWRKLSFGTQSAAGSRFVETILTVVETCRQQSRNVFEYLTTTMDAHFARQPAPSLLPGV